MGIRVEIEQTSTNHYIEKTCGAIEKVFFGAFLGAFVKGKLNIYHGDN